MNIRIHTEDGASAPEDSKRRVIVLIDASADIMSLLVRAKKEAAFKNLPCQGVYVPAKPWRRSRLRQQQQNVSKAQELGIPVKKLAARSRLGIVGALRREHVHHPIDQLLISRRKRGLFFKWPFYMARRDGTPAFPVQVIDSFSSKRMKSMLLHSSHWDYIWTLVSVVGLSAIGYVLSRVLPLPIFSSIDHNIPFAYVVLIFVAAMRLGLGPLSLQRRSAFLPIITCFWCRQPRI